MIRAIEPEQVPAEWGRAGPMIQRALDRFDYGESSDDVLLSLMRGERELWMCGDDAAVILQVCRLPQFQVLDIPLMAGDNMDAWLPDLVSQLTRYAKAIGCKYIDGFGRKGWTRKLQEFGFEPYSYDVRLKV